MKAKFLIAGNSAISVQLGEDISLEVNRKVRMLYAKLKENPIDGVVEMVPTYASLTLHYKPEVILFSPLKEEIEKRMTNLGEASKEKKIVKEIPICYEGELGLDLEECAKLQGVSQEEIVRMHSEHEYYAYMLGFAPGHAYMARFSEPFRFKRRESPRVRIDAGSIVVQENLSNFIPFDQPCGWNIIGTTPLKICDYKRQDPFLVHAGEWVKFIPVTTKEYHRIKEEDQHNKYLIKTYERVVM